MIKRKPYPKNVEGDFYVEDGCCTLCALPWSVASALFGVDETAGHCFVKRQPETPLELDQMISAVCAAETECIRYRGKDREILRRLLKSKAGRQCDSLTWWRRLIL